MKILNYVELIDSVRSNRTELYTKKHKNNQKIRKSSGTVRRDKIELVRLSSVRFENLLKFDSFTVRTPVPNTVLWKIFNMFDRIKLIKHYIFFNKIKIFSMFDVCLRRCKHQTLS